MRTPALRRIAVLGIVPLAMALWPGAASAGAVLGHRLAFRYAQVRSGQVEPFREDLANHGATEVVVTVLGEVLLPCGGFIDIDPIPLTVPPGGVAHLNVAFPTQPGCTGTYLVTVDGGNQNGSFEDTGSFVAT